MKGTLRETDGQLSNFHRAQEREILSVPWHSMSGFPLTGSPAGLEGKSFLFTRQS